MNHPLIAASRLLVAVAVAAGTTLGAHAQSAPECIDPFVAIPMHACEARPGPGDRPPPDRGRGAPWPDFGLIGPGDMTPTPAMLRGILLSDAQRDKVFAIVHAQVPLVREKTKTARQAFDELRALAGSEQFDRTKGAALADVGARALADLTLLRAEGDHRIFDVLTDVQRLQVEAMQPPVRCR